MRAEGGGEIGLAGTGRPDAEHRGMGAHQAEIGGLRRRAGARDLLLRGAFLLGRAQCVRTFWRAVSREPLRLLGNTASMRTRWMPPIRCAASSTCTDCR